MTPAADVEADMTGCCRSGDICAALAAVAGKWGPAPFAITDFRQYTSQPSQGDVNRPRLQRPVVLICRDICRESSVETLCGMALDQALDFSVLRVTR